MRLQHLHVLQPMQYPMAEIIQNGIVRQHIDFGLARQNAFPSSYEKHQRPQPFLLTFETNPTYTCGRREISSIGEDRIEYLRNGGRAAFYPALRGGQTTFHGPGQLTAYLITSLKAHALTPRCYVRFLESSVITLCAHYNILACTTSDPGVWLAEQKSIDNSQSTADHKADLEATNSKICAVGVHMRRGVSSHGIGLNINSDLTWFERIVACGLVGKRVTSFEELGIKGLQVRDVAFEFSCIVASGLDCVSGVDHIEISNEPASK